MGQTAPASRLEGQGKTFFMGQYDTGTLDRRRGMWMDMSPEEMEAKRQMVVDKCTCGGCPLWFECGESIGFLRFPLFIYPLQDIGALNHVRGKLGQMSCTGPSYPTSQGTQWIHRSQRF